MSNWSNNTNSCKAVCIIYCIIQTAVKLFVKSGGREVMSNNTNSCKACKVSLGLRPVIVTLVSLFRNSLALYTLI